MEFFWQKRLNERKSIENKSSNQEAKGVKEPSSFDTEENLFALSDTTSEYLEKNEWENISFSEEEEQIVVYLENGTRISSSTDAENFIVLRNKETGEVIISGGDNLIVTGSDDEDILSVLNSNINNIYLGTGNDTIYVENSTGSVVAGDSGNDSIYVLKSEIEAVYGGSGEDKIIIDENSEFEDIFTESGNDTVYAQNSKITNSIDTGSEDDYIYTNNTSIVEITTGDGADEVYANNSSIDKISTKTENDVVVLNEAKKKTTIDAGRGNDIISINNSNGVVAQGGKGQDSFLVDSSNITTDKRDDDEIYITQEIDMSEYISQMDEETINAAQEITQQKVSEITDRDLIPEEELQALAIENFQNNLVNMKAQFQAQEDEDGIIRDGYNLYKQLLDIGVSKEDIDFALAEQEQMVVELEAAFNGESEYSFEEVFEKWTGIPYNQEALIEYTQSQNIYEMAVLGMQKAETFASQVKSAENMQEVFELYIQYYGSEDVAREKLNEFLETAVSDESISASIEKIYLTDDNKLVRIFAEEKSLLFSEFEQGDILDDLSSIPNLFDYYKVSDEAYEIYVQDFKSSFETTMGYSIETAQSKYATAQITAIGSGNSFQKLIDRYCAEQEGFIDKLASIAQIGGMCCMAVGGILTLAFPVSVGVGVSLMQAGKWMSLSGTFGDNALELVDEVSTWETENFSPQKIAHFREIEKNYDEIYVTLSDEEKKEYNDYIKQRNDIEAVFKETIVDALLYFSGKGIGATSSSINADIAKNYGKALGCLAEIGVDGTLSLMTDLIITGEVDLSNEGISQILGIVSGLAGAKVEQYTKQSIAAATQRLIETGDTDAAISHLIMSGVSTKTIIKFAESLGIEVTKSDISAYKTGELDIPFSKKNSQESSSTVDVIPIQHFVETESKQSEETSLNENINPDELNSKQVQRAVSEQVEDLDLDKQAEYSSSKTEEEIGQVQTNTNDVSQQNIKNSQEQASVIFNVLKQQGIEEASATFLSQNITEAQIENVVKLKQAGFVNDANVIEYAQKFDSDDIQEMIDTFTAGLLTEKEISILLDLQHKPIEARAQNKIDFFTEEQIIKLIKVIAFGVNVDSAVYVAENSNIQLEDIQKLVSVGIKNFAGLQLQQNINIDDVILLKNEGFSDYFALASSNMPLQQKQIMITLKQSGLQEISAYSCSFDITQEQIPSIISLKQAGISDDNAIKFVKELESSDLPKIIEIKNAGFAEDSLLSLFAIQDDFLLNNAKILKGNGCEDKDILKFLNLDRSSRNMVVRLNNLGVPFSYALSLSDLSETSFQRIFQAYFDKGLTGTEILAFQLKASKNPEMRSELEARIFELARLRDFFNQGEFYSKVSGEDWNSENQRNAHFSNLHALLDLPSDSQTRKYIDFMIGLASSGYLNASAMRNFSTRDYGSWSVSPFMRTDLELMDSVARNFPNSQNLNVTLMYNYVPSVVSENEGISSSKVGDAFQVEGEEFIRIKTSETTSQQMNISRETYFNLFMPAQRFATSQQIMGDCYCIETFMALYQDPLMRSSIVSLFSETTDGQLTINLPRGLVSVTTPKNSLPASENPGTYSSGATGFKLLEYAYGVNCVENMIRDVQSRLSGSELADFVEFVERNGKNNVFINLNSDGTVSYKTFTQAIEDGSYRISKEDRSYGNYTQYLLGNGGYTTLIFDRLGIQHESFYLQNNDDFSVFRAMVMSNSNFFSEHLVTASFSGHAYSLTYQPDESAYYLFNPHQQALPIRITNLDAFLSQERPNLTVVKKA